MDHALQVQEWPRKVLGWLRAARLSAGQAVPLAFGSVILLGTLLLMLPGATTGPDIRFIDALFTMTSAVCVTGLIVLDTSKDFTLFGQVVILLGIQLGGFGYSIMATLLLLALGRRIGLRDRMMMMEVLNTVSMDGLVRFVKAIVVITLLIEGVAAAILTARFAMDMDPLRALYFGIFHSVSAFNNAGFSLFSDGLTRYRSDLTVNLTVSTVIILGGIGFLVFQDVRENLLGERFRLSTHTKLVLVVTALLIVGGTAGVWALEVQNAHTLAPLSVGEQGLVAYFQTVSVRTAGFSTVDVSLMTTPTLYLLILQMVIGGSPGSTGGGIKTTTFGIICATIWAMLRGRADVMMFHRRISQELVIKSFVLATLYLGLVTGVTGLLAYIEEQDFLRLMFEVASAAATVGMSTGNGGTLSFSALFSDVGKSVIILTILLGRLGPLALGLFAVRTHRELRYRYAEARVVIG